MAGKSRQDHKLQAALAALLEEQPFDQITVRAICTTAAVHRSTFYRYYVDKYSLLQEMCVGMYKRNVQAGTTNLIENFFQMLLDHRNLFRNITVNNSNPLTFLFIEQIVANEILKNATTPALAHHVPEAVRRAFARSQDHKITATFFAGALVGVSIDWINSNFAMSKENIVANYLNCVR